MSKHYENPPLVQAICEFRFSSESWDLTILSDIYAKIKDEFPKKRVERQVTFNATLGATGSELINETVDRQQFIRDNGTGLVQVSENFLSINILGSYGVWENFRGVIEKTFHAYIDVAQPINSQSISVRYINQINLPAKEADLEKYFLFYPYVGPNLPQKYGPFVSVIFAPYEEGRDTLRLQLISIANPDALSIQLDLTYGNTTVGSIPFTDTLSWADTAHRHVKEVFEASITAETRKLFGEVLE